MHNLFRVTMVSDVQPVLGYEAPRTKETLKYMYVVCRKNEQGGARGFACANSCVYMIYVCMFVLGDRSGSLAAYKCAVIMVCLRNGSSSWLRVSRGMCGRLNGTLLWW